MIRAEGAGKQHPLNTTDTTPEQPTSLGYFDMRFTDGLLCDHEVFEHADGSRSVRMWFGLMVGDVTFVTLAETLPFPFSLRERNDAQAFLSCQLMMMVHKAFGHESEEAHRTVDLIISATQELRTPAPLRMVVDTRGVTEPVSAMVDAEQVITTDSDGVMSIAVQYVHSDGDLVNKSKVVNLAMPITRERYLDLGNMAVAQLLRSILADTRRTTAERTKRANAVLESMNYTRGPERFLKKWDWMEVAEEMKAMRG